MTTTNFEEWLNTEGIETAEDMLQIYRPLTTGEKGWMYEIKSAKGSTSNVIVTGGKDVLVLTTKSRKAFIKHMDSKFELGVEGQYALDHAMEKND